MCFFVWRQMNSNGEKDDARDNVIDLQRSQELLPTIVRLLRWRELQESLSSSWGFVLSFSSTQICVVVP